MITIYPDDKTKELWRQIKKKAVEEGKTASDIAREAFEEWLKRHGAGNPSFQITKWVDNSDFHAMPTLGENPDKYPITNWTKQELIEGWIQARVWLKKFQIERIKRGENIERFNL